MVNYRRNYCLGGCHFFTVNLRNRKSKFLIEYIELLRYAMRRVQQEKYYEIKAIVVLPEHLHCIWQLPSKDANYSQRWKEIKKHFTQGVKQAGVCLEKDNRGEYNLWQRRYWEHTIRDERDFENHVNYIHYNPVKHGYVKRVKEKIGRILHSINM